MDLDALKKLAGITPTKPLTSLNIDQAIAERRREMMKNVMKESREETLELQKLPYKTSELAPVLSKENVEYHYNILSAGYVNRYNNDEGDADFNYGGAKLHNLFWQQLKPAKQSSNYDGYAKQTIDANYGDLKGFTEALVKEAMTIQGSGWVYMTKTGTIKTTPNQSYKTEILMPIDMWEHSFTDYIPAKDAKSKYIEGIIKLIDWDAINRRLEV
jgi:Fe-Mn family superoxide dismutase